MPRQSTGHSEPSLLRTITRPFSSAYASLMRATGRTHHNETHYSGAGGVVGNAGEGRRHGARR